MIQVLADVQVEDLQRFIAIFATRGAEMRGKHGCLKSRIFRASDDDGRVILLLDWQSREAFDGFLQDPAVNETMKSSGTIPSPKFTFLSAIAELPH